MLVECKFQGCDDIKYDKIEVYDNYKKFIDNILTILGTKYMLNYIYTSGKKINEENYFEIMNNYVSTVYISTIPVMNISELIDFCYKYSDMKLIDSTKMVATMFSGVFIKYFLENFDKYSIIEQNSFIEKLNDLDISIYINKTGNANKIIFYNSNRLNEFSNKLIENDLLNKYTTEHILYSLTNFISDDPMKSIMHIVFDDVKMNIIKDYSDIENNVYEIYKKFIKNS